jgi:hypothetical protein
MGKIPDVVGGLSRANVIEMKRSIGASSEPPRSRRGT